MDSRMCVGKITGCPAPVPGNILRLDNRDLFEGSSDAQRSTRADHSGIGQLGQNTSRSSTAEGFFDFDDDPALSPTIFRAVDDVLRICTKIEAIQSPPSSKSERHIFTVLIVIADIAAQR